MRPYGNAHALDARDVAEILGVSPSLVYKLAREGSLASYHAGRKLRFTADDVEEYIRSTSHGGSARTAEGAPSGRDGACDGRSQGGTSPAGGTATAKDDAAYLDAITASRRPAPFALAGRGIVADVLAQHLDGFGLDVRREYRDGYAGLIAVYMGNADAAVISLWDGKSKTCNIPYVQRLMPGTPCVVMTLGDESYGLVVRRGNPKKIRNWASLLKSDITVANREPGTPQRILLDEELIQLEASPARIAGYDRVLQSELALGDFVARGGADVGVATEDLFHKVEGLDFLPQKKIELALVMRKSPAARNLIKLVRGLLQSRNFQDLLVNAPGPDVKGMGRVIYEV